jgi:hypothetical protein
MGTEVKEVAPAANGHSSDVAVGDIAAAPVVMTPPPPQRRAPARVVIAITSVIAVVIAGVIGYNFAARQYTADGAVRQYLSELQAGDASAAWDEVEVSAVGQPVSASLVAEGALQAALRAAKLDLASFEVTGSRDIDSSTAMVSVSYVSASGSEQANLTVRRSGRTRFAVFPVWLVVLQPVILQLTLPAGATNIAVDGIPVALTAGKSSVAVLPVAHQIRFDGSTLLTPQTANIDVFGVLGQSVQYKASLTDSGLSSVKAAVEAAFESCAHQTLANALDTTPCPQTVSHASADRGTWAIVGDPTADMVVSFDGDMNATAKGHFQMVFAYQIDSLRPSPQHEPSGGGYSAALSLTDSGVRVGQISPADGLPAVVRPAGAPDQAVEAIVSAAFAKCVTGKSDFVSDCPQALATADAGSVHWRISGDPLSGATVQFDPNTGLFTLSGTFNMSASYTWLGNPESATSLTSAYAAYLFWDGQALNLVTIDGQ